MLNNNIAEFLFQICRMIACAASIRPAQTEEDNKPTTHYWYSPAVRISQIDVNFPAFFVKSRHNGRVSERKIRSNGSFTIQLMWLEHSFYDELVLFIY